MATVTLDQITKTYNKGEVLAVDNVSFDVKDGELFGLIGPDGAGKTSVFRMLTTLLLADKGSATVAGFDVVKDYREIRNRVGYMPGKFSLYQDLTVKENLNFFATVFGTTIEENYDLIKDIYDQIKPFNDRRAGKLSGGMKQKLALCCALIHKPEVLFLDEPTTGLDSSNAFKCVKLLKKLTTMKNILTIAVVHQPSNETLEMFDSLYLLSQDGAKVFHGQPRDVLFELSYFKPKYFHKRMTISEIAIKAAMLTSRPSWQSLEEKHVCCENAECLPLNMVFTKSDVGPLAQLTYLTTRSVNQITIKTPFFAFKVNSN